MTFGGSSWSVEMRRELLFSTDLLRRLMRPCGKTLRQIRRPPLPIPDMHPEPADGPRPRLVVVAGPNGAGKTTLTERALTHEWLKGCEYINPDQIAQAVYGNWNDPQAILNAAREANRRRESCLEQGRSMAFETVFSTEEKLTFVRRAQPDILFESSSSVPILPRSMQNVLPLASWKAVMTFQSTRSSADMASPSAILLV